MSFSLFGKKPTPPARSATPTSRPAPQPPTSRPAPDGAASQAAAPLAKPAPAAPKPAVDNGLDKAAPSRQHEALEFTPSQPTAAPAKAEAQARKPRPEISLRENLAAMHPVAEEAAMLYANGRADDTRVLLESAVRINMGRGAELVWAELFDLYTLLGDRTSFEALALAFIERFEKSPPSWTPLPEASKAAVGNGPATLNLSGKLTEASLAQFDQLRRLAQKNPHLRLDLGKLQDADDKGCGLLMECLQEMLKAGKEIHLLGAAHLSSLLETQLDTSRRDSPHIWRLLLQLYQDQMRQAPFEELALQYAVTFEESPPSWEERRQGALKADAPATPQVGDAAFPLHGEITGGGSEVLGALSSHAANLTQVHVDASALRRMDFVSAGMLLNSLSHLATLGKVVKISGVHALLFALFRVLGIAEVADVEMRK